MYEMAGNTRFGWIKITSTGKGLQNVRFLLDGASIQNNADSVSRETWIQIEAWCEGARRDFDLPLDLDVTPERRQWMKVLAKIPYGETVSYAEFARRWGNPKAARAAGSACSGNPIPLIIPCHRVTQRDGSLGNFGGIDGLSPKDPRNLELKQSLIDHEKRYVRAA
jgi:methylated-DNA-[protein]-cysteine S-methyltransferase